MTKRTLRNHAPAFTAKVALAALRGEKRLAKWFSGSMFIPIRSRSGKAPSRSVRTARGPWRDNVFIERLWRGLKYEEVYPRAYASVGDARASITRYLTFYDERRPHSSLDQSTPDEAYITSRMIAAAA